MKTLEQIKEFLQGKSLVELSRQVRLSRQYLWRMQQGRAPNPSHDTVARLSEFIEKTEKESCKK